MKPVMSLIRYSRILILLVFGLSGMYTAYGAVQTNLVSNPDMESGTGSPSNWATSYGSGTVTQIWATDKYVSCADSLKTVVTVAGQTDWRPTATFPVDTTAKYRFRAHVYATNVASGSHDVEVQWFNGSTFLRRDIVASTTANAWVEVEDLHLVPPSNATQVYLLLRSYSVGTYWFDDASFEREDVNLFTLPDGKFPMLLYDIPDSQLLFNSDMEASFESTQCPQNGVGNIPAGWYTNLSSGAATFTWDTTKAYTGSRSFNIDMTTAGEAFLGQYVPVIDPTKTYILSGAVYASTASGVWLDIEWYNSSGSWLSQSDIWPTTTNAWQVLTSSAITPPSTASQAYVLCLVETNGSFNFDDVTLSLNRTLTDRYTEAYNAGFNLLRFYGGATTDLANLPAGMYASYDCGDGVQYVPNPPSTNLVTDIDAIKNCSNLGMWETCDQSHAGLPL